ncbi:MAG: 3-hydroxyisobutyrate dehydrogenase [Pseudomonadales bacterium]|nr:3-hydroxyisobutyrate dehydrogenase [Pseudomonadales bacterium]
MEKVAFIGLGNMGSGMAANLVRSGFQVVAFDLAQAALEAATAAGCKTVSSAVEAVSGADFVVSMLPSGAIVERVYIDDDKLLDTLPASTLVIDCSTVAAKNSQRVAAAAAQRGIRAIDAPVSGGVAAAAAGTLSFMCGGSEEACDAARPVLGAMGSHIFRAGDAGAGQTAKICNNMLLAVHMIGTCEALQLGVDNGLDPATLSEIMRNSSGGNWSLEMYNPYPGVMPKVPASRNYEGGFMNRLMLKDLGLALESASASHSAAPMGSLARSLYALHAGQGHLDKDFSGIMQLFSRRAESSSAD